MKKKIYYLLFSSFIIFIILGIVVFYLATINFEQVRMKPLYDVPDNKLWAHAADNIEKARNAIKEFPGMELDIVFDDSLDDFDVRHDVGRAATGLNLEHYFESIPHPEMYYYWLDFKNLDKMNEKKALKQMEYILDKFHLFNNVIIESRNPESLSIFSREGIYTSYWIPHFEYKKGNLLKRLYINYKVAYRIQSILKENNFNAISAHYRMYEFMDRYFPNANIHLWTNRLKTEADKKIILDLANKKNIKVILVDYKKNFLSDTTNLVTGDTNNRSDIFAHGYSKAPLAVDIKANGSDGPIKITTKDVLKITVSLAPGEHMGEISNWYIAKYTTLSAAWSHYEQSSHSWKPGFALSYRGELFDLSPRTVLQRSGLPAGEYTFFFQIRINGDKMDSDSVKVNIQ